MSIFETIKTYQKVCLYRHVNPDFDAYGSQLGMAHILRQHFPQIKIMLKGQRNEELLTKLEEDYIWDSFDDVSDALAIVLDTANHERIDGEDYIQCAARMKIDHHLIVDSFGDINIEEPTKSSTSQIVTELYQAYFKEPMDRRAAACLYFGMIADSNRFLFRSTDGSTLKAGAYLLECGIDMEHIYQRMYLRKEMDLRINRFILNRYESTASGIAYYTLNQADLDELDITRERGSDYVNMLSNIQEFRVWMAITQNSEANNWRVSMRSRDVSVNKVAEQFNGGGHQLASGATLESIDDLPKLIEAIEEQMKRD